MAALITSEATAEGVLVVIATRQSPEHEEGVRAFLDKREPDFR